MQASTPIVKTTMQASTPIVTTTMHASAPIVKTTMQVSTPIVKATMHASTPIVKTTMHASTPIVKTTMQVSTPIVKTTMHASTPIVKTTMHASTPIVKATPPPWVDCFGFDALVSESDLLPSPVVTKLARRSVGTSVGHRRRDIDASALLEDSGCGLELSSTSAVASALSTAGGRSAV
ncbi:PREDICTED: endochitinase A1-like, partial [Priapulus caudatus]|uniref:Endochitinase A1-like n=1 Tax=Priapulus caudatus TaxID=37621 RepID=A0ABM1F324_PRICU